MIKKLILLWIILLLPSLSLTAEKKFGILDIFAPSLKPQHQQIRDIICSTINTEDKKWEISTYYPIEKEHYTCFEMIPEGYDRENWLELYDFSFLDSEEGETIDVLWEKYAKVTRLPKDGVKEILSRDDNELVFQFYIQDPLKPHRCWHEYGLMYKVENKYYRCFSYEVKQRNLNDLEKKTILAQLRKVNNAY